MNNQLLSPENSVLVPQFVTPVGARIVCNSCNSLTVVLLTRLYTLTFLSASNVPVGWLIAKTDPAYPIDAPNELLNNPAVPTPAPPVPAFAQVNLEPTTYATPLVPAIVFH